MEEGTENGDSIEGGQAKKDTWNWIFFLGMILQGILVQRKLPTIYEGNPNEISK